MKRALLSIAIACLLIGQAQAARYAIVVGNNTGRGLDAPLRYAETDAHRVANVLTELGGFDASWMRVLPSPTAESVEQAFAAAALEIERTHDANALLLFYYSGHADGSSLHLGETTIELGHLRSLLAASHASVRIGILDACGTGALTSREKGLTQAPPFMITAPSELATRGQVIIAAVSSSESAQESDSLKGSFFTTYLVSGLRGAADHTGVGRVTLDDAYRYAYAQTVRATMLSRAGAQHPSYNVDLSGQGDLVLTEPRKGRSRLIIRPEARGEFVIFTPAQNLVAEVSVEKDEGAMLALDAGDYEVQKRGAGSLRFAKIHLGAGEERELREGRMQQLDYMSLARKGVSPRIRIGVGYSGWLTSLPNGMPLIRVAADLDAHKLVVTPRLTLGYQSYTESQVLATEWFFAAGVALTHAWERGRFEFHLGGAVDAAMVQQEAFGLTTHTFGGLLSLVAGAGVRVKGGLSLTLEAEPGGIIVGPSTGVAVHPFLLGFIGVRYDL